MDTELVRETVAGAMLVIPAAYLVIRVSSPLLRRHKRVSSLPVDRQQGGVGSGFFAQYTLKWLDNRVEHRRIKTEAEIAKEKLKLEHSYRLGVRDKAHVSAAVQVLEHSVPQSHSNQVANYAPLEPFVDEFRDRVLLALVSVYDGDRMADDGRITVRAPWSKRGGFSKLDADRAVRMFEEARRVNGAWVAELRNNAWYVNRKIYDTPGKLVRAFANVNTPA